MEKIINYFYNEYPETFLELNSSLHSPINSWKKAKKRELRDRNSGSSKFQLLWLLHPLITYACLEMIVLFITLLCDFFSYTQIFRERALAVCVLLHIILAAIFFGLTLIQNYRYDYRYDEALQNFINKYDNNLEEAVIDLEQAIGKIKNRTSNLKYILDLYAGLVFSVIVSLELPNLLTTNPIRTFVVVFFPIVYLLYFIKRVYPIYLVKQAIKALRRKKQ